MTVFQFRSNADQNAEPSVIAQQDNANFEGQRNISRYAEVKLPTRVVAGKKNVFEMKDIIFDDPINIHVDKENPTPLVRIPPIFPNRFLQGDVSGYCKIRFDVSPEGQPMNIQTTLCTNTKLKSATVKSVQKWKYSPRIQNGRPVSRSGLETTIRFDLRDERGNLLPLPSGF